MSSGLYSHTTRAVGTVLTAAIYNADHSNHITNHNPSMMGAYSDTLAQHQLTSDPGGLGSENLAGSLAVELEQIRFCIKRITGKTHWYEAAVTDLASGVADNTITNAKLADMATARIKGRTTAGTGDPEDLTGTQTTALLDGFVGDSGSGGTKGLVPAPASGDAAANKMLGAGGTWGFPSATQAEMVTGTATNKFVVPGLQHRHSLHPKAWGKANAAGAIQADMGISSVTDHGTGDVSWNWDTAFSSADYGVNVSILITTNYTHVVGSQTTSSIRCYTWTGGANAADPTNYFVSAFGSQA